MQKERYQLQDLRIGALPILNRFIERMGLEEELTLALRNAGYADALLALMKNILVDRNARLCDFGMGGTVRCGSHLPGQDQRRQAGARPRPAVLCGPRHLADAHRAGGHQGI